MSIFLIALILGVVAGAYCIFRLINPNKTKQSIRQEVKTEEENDKLKKENQKLIEENSQLKNKVEETKKSNKKFKIIFWIAVSIIFLAFLGMIVG